MYTTSMPAQGKPENKLYAAYVKFRVQASIWLAG